jgi:hypothetical protein
MENDASAAHAPLAIEMPMLNRGASTPSTYTVDQTRVRGTDGGSSNRGDTNTVPPSHTQYDVLNDNDSDSELLSESSHRYTHSVKPSPLHNPDRSDDEYGHLADDVTQLVDMSNINDSAEESAIVEEIERKVGFGALGSEGGGLVGLAGLAKSSSTTAPAPGIAPVQPAEMRGRSSSMIQATKDLINRVRFRKNSQDSADNIEFMPGEKVRYTGLQYLFVQGHKVITYLVPDFSYRANAYMAALFLLLVSYIADSYDRPGQVLKLFVCTAALEFVCSMLDRVVYKIIDMVFASRFDIAYQLHSLNGPLGLILTVLIIRNFWHILDARQLIQGWRSYVTAAAVFIICLCAKNWIGRRQYVYLLERRFTDKVENLNSMIIILSELASTRPPKSVRLQRAVTKLGDGEGNSMHSSNTGGGSRSGGHKLASKVRSCCEPSLLQMSQLVISLLISSGAKCVLGPRGHHCSGGRFRRGAHQAGTHKIASATACMVPLLLTELCFCVGAVPQKALLLAVSGAPQPDSGRHEGHHLQRRGHAAVPGAGAAVRAEAVQAPEQGRQGGGDAGPDQEAVRGATGGGDERLGREGGTRACHCPHHLGASLLGHI